MYSYVILRYVLRFQIFLFLLLACKTTENYLSRRTDVKGKQYLAGWLEFKSKDKMLRREKNSRNEQL